MPANENKKALDILLQTLNENPELWETRRKTAKLLYADEQYLEAADILWNAPEIPSTDIDVAFTIKIISRVKPNRSIRLIYEVIRRNKDKPQKSMAVARALNDIGMYMEAARFYGAALATDTSLFDLGFERQMLWLDDSGKLIEEWRKSDQEAKPPLDVPQQQITGGVFTPNTIPENVADKALSGAPLREGGTPPPSPAPGSVTPPAGAPSAPATRPLMVAGGSPPPSPISPTPSQAMATAPKNPLLRPGAAKTQPLAVPTPTNPLQAPSGQASKATNTAPLSPPNFNQQAPPAQNPTTRPTSTPLVSPGMGSRTDTQPLTPPGSSSQKLLPQRPPSMLSSPPVATQPLAMSPMSSAPAPAPPAPRPISQPVAYAPVSTQPLSRAPQSQPLAPGQQVPQPSASQPIGYVQTPQGLMPIQPMPSGPLANAPAPASPQFKLK